MKNLLQTEPRRRNSVDEDFTLFVVLPTEDVCTLRHLPSGISVEEVKSRMELAAGLPSHIYQLVYPDGECLKDNRNLLMQKNVRDGYILRVVLHENWDSLYLALVKNQVDHICHGEALNIKGNIAIHKEDVGKVDSIVSERRNVALYIAAFLGHIKMCNTLVSIGADINGKTPFGRTPLHVAACRDNAKLLNELVHLGGLASVTDVYGQTPGDTATSYSSQLCVKKLRLMQLNLRGETKTFHDRQPLRTPSAEPPKTPSPEPPQRMTRSITITLPTDAGRDSYTKTPISRPESRAVDSRASEGRPILNVSTPVQPWDVLPARKSIFAGDKMFSPRFLLRFNNNAKRGQNIMLDRQNVKHTENLSANEKNAQLFGKQLSMLRSKRTLKFANEDDRKTEDASIVSGSTVYTAPYILAPNSSRVSDGWRMERFDKSDDAVSQTQSEPVKDMRKLKIDLENQTILPPTPVPTYERKSSKHVRFSAKSRSLAYPPKHKGTEAFRNMKRKINLIASHQNGQVLKTKFRYGDTYERWLMKKKKAERKNPKPDSSSEDDSDDDSDRENSAAYNQWLDDKKHNRTKYDRPITGNRPIQGLINIGSTELGDPTPPDSSTHIHAHREWRERRRSKTPNYERRRNGDDFMEEKRRLEEKRQKLMMMALSYEEWMDHDEERKTLIRKILRADLEQLKEIEVERLRIRASRQISHDDWKLKIQKRQEEDKKRREIQLKYQEEQDRWKVDHIRSSAAISHDEWLRYKGLSRLKEKPDMAKLSDSEADKHPSELDEIYTKWLNKHQGEKVNDVKRKTENENETMTSLGPEITFSLVKSSA